VTAHALLRGVATAHALFDVITGVWPIVHRRSFEAVTGRKREGWLVQTVGALVAVVGGVIGSAAIRDAITPEIVGLATASAAALATVDLVFVSRRRISPIYLADACVEGLLVAAWAGAARADRLRARLAT
jgi:hypothetical protein